MSDPFEADLTPAQIEQQAKAMGMTVEDYEMGMTARKNFTKTLSTARCESDSNNRIVSITQDANNPPQHLQVTLLQDKLPEKQQELSESIVNAWKDVNAKAKKVRLLAQQDMLTYVNEELQKRKKS